MSDPAPEPATFPAAIAGRLRREILTGVLPPGSPIKERDHAERLGVSRTPLREAVRILETARLRLANLQLQRLVSERTEALEKSQLALLQVQKLEVHILFSTFMPWFRNSEIFVAKS